MPELVREDQVIDGRPAVALTLQIVQVDEEQCQRSEPLLAVDDEVLAVLVADDDGAEEVVAVVLDVAEFVVLAPVVVELVDQVLNEFLTCLVSHLYSRW